MIKANGHYVLIKPQDITETDAKLKGAKEAGIYIPEDQIYREQEAANIGTLVDIGPDAWDAFGSDSPWAEVGDIVYFPRHTGNTVQDQDTEEKFIIMTDERVIATYKRDT